MVHRVWQKEPRWRFEQLRTEQPDWAPPADADAYWDYYLPDDWKPGTAVPKAGKPTAAGQTIGPNALMGPDDDPVLPF